MKSLNFSRPGLGMNRCVLKGCNPAERERLNRLGKGGVKGEADDRG